MSQPSSGPEGSESPPGSGRQDENCADERARFLILYLERLADERLRLEMATEEFLKIISE